MTTPFKSSMGGLSISSTSDADMSMEGSDDVPVESMLSSPPRAPRSVSRTRSAGGSFAHRLFEDNEEDEDDQYCKRSPVLKPLDLNLDLNDVTAETSASASGAFKERKRHAESALDGRDVSFDDVESPVEMHQSPHISPSCYKSPANTRSIAHKSPSSFRTLDGRMVTSKNPFSPMLMEDHTPTRTNPIGDALTFPVSLDDASKKPSNDEGSLPVLRHRLHKRETGREFVRDGYPAKSGEFRGFTGSPIDEMGISGKVGWNNHKVRRIKKDDDVVAAASYEETAKSTWKKKIHVKTKHSICNGGNDDISPTEVMHFPLMGSPRSPSASVPPTPTKPRHYRRPPVKRYTPVRKNAHPPNTPMPQRRAQTRSFDLDEDDGEKNMGSESSPSNRHTQSRFHSDFDVIGELGTGSFGNVLKVLSRLDGCMYAIKMAHRPAKGNADKDRMLKEIKNDQFKLGDFGLVTKVSQHQDVEEGDSRYMSMELLSGDHSDLTKSDIFSLGITLYELCLGGRELPTNGPEWQDLRAGKIPLLPNTSLEMQNFINIMMNPSYSSRPAAGDLLKRPQLLSEEQKELLIERNKVIQANLALAEQTNRLRRLAPPPAMPRKGGVLVRANTWNGN
eukprot:scaffold3084_cov144-Cylindrotheca_fusiformis.AAC.8